MKPCIGSRMSFRYLPNYTNAESRCVTFPPQAGRTLPVGKPDGGFGLRFSNSNSLGLCSDGRATARSTADVSWPQGPKPHMSHPAHVSPRTGPSAHGRRRLAALPVDQLTRRASVSALMVSRSTPGAISTTLRPPSTTSKTPRLVMIRLTTPRPVSGRVQAARSLDSPALLA